MNESGVQSQRKDKAVFANALEKKYMRKWVKQGEWTSINVELEDKRQQERLFTALSENGKVMMPLNNYIFSKKFGNVEEQFGLSG